MYIILKFKKVPEVDIMLNLLEDCLERKGNALGTFLGVTTPAIMEAISSSGLDFVIIDTEHGPYGTESVSDLISTSSLLGISPLVRIADLTHGEMQHALDNGADGVIIPCLREVDEFRKAVDLGKFPPLGNRGFIKGRGSRFGSEDWASGNLDEYLENSDRKALILPQCETAEALDHIEEIVNIEGIDGIFIGPFDLSISLGIPGQFGDQRFLDALERIYEACRAAGKMCLIFANTPEDGRRYLREGYDAVAVGTDFQIFAGAMAETVRKARR